MHMMHIYKSNKWLSMICRTSQILRNGRKIKTVKFLFLLSIVGQGPTALAVGVGGGCLDIFTLVYFFTSLSPSLRETARCRL